MAAAVHPTAPRTGLRGFLLGEKQATTTTTTTTADRPRARAPGLWETGTFVSLPKALLHFRAPAFQIWSIELASPLGGHHTSIFTQPGLAPGSLGTRCTFHSSSPGNG